MSSIAKDDNVYKQLKKREKPPKLTCFVLFWNSDIFSSKYWERILLAASDLRQGTWRVCCFSCSAATVWVTAMDDARTARTADILAYNANSRISSAFTSLTNEVRAVISTISLIATPICGTASKNITPISAPIDLVTASPVAFIAIPANVRHIAMVNVPVMSRDVTPKVAIKLAMTWPNATSAAIPISVQLWVTGNAIMRENIKIVIKVPSESCRDTIAITAPVRNPQLSDLLFLFLFQTMLQPFVVHLPALQRQPPWQIRQQPRPQQRPWCLTLVSQMLQATTFLWLLLKVQLQWLPVLQQRPQWCWSLLPR